MSRTRQTIHRNFKEAIMMKESTRLNITRTDIWTRGLYMLLLMLAYNLAEAAIVLTAIFQFFCALITGTVNEPLLQFSKNATVYIKQVLEFLTFNSEERPFPFSAWPDEDHTGDEWLDDEFEEDDYVDDDVTDANVAEAHEVDDLVVDDIIDESKDSDVGNESSTDRDKY
jgi:hypothetical protein